MAISIEKMQNATHGTNGLAAIAKGCIGPSTSETAHAGLPGSTGEATCTECDAIITQAHEEMILPKVGELAAGIGLLSSAMPGLGTTGNTPDGTECLSCDAEKEPGVPTGCGVSSVVSDLNKKRKIMSIAKVGEMSLGGETPVMAFEMVATMYKVTSMLISLGKAERVVVDGEHMANDMTPKPCDVNGAPYDAMSV